MGFEFSKKKHIEIRGKQYRLEVEDVGFMIAVNTHFPEINRKMQEIADTKKVIAPLSAKLKGPKTTKDELDSIVKQVEQIRIETHQKKLDCLEDMKYFIKGCLEPGSYEIIFDGIPENFKDHYDLCAYIFTEAYASRSDVINEFLKPEGNKSTTTNRAQKRAIKPAKKKTKEVVEDVT